MPGHHSGLPYVAADRNRFVGPVDPQFARAAAFVQGVQPSAEGEERRVGLVPEIPYRELDQGARRPVGADKDALKDAGGHQEMHEGNATGLFWLQTGA